MNESGRRDRFLLYRVFSLLNCLFVREGRDRERAELQRQERKDRREGGGGEGKEDSRERKGRNGGGEGDLYEYLREGIIAAFFFWAADAWTEQRTETTKKEEQRNGKGERRREGEREGGITSRVMLLYRIYGGMAIPHLQISTIAISALSHSPIMPLFLSLSSARAGGWRRWMLYNSS